ncbi:MAG: adenylate/guanylate cyclase domain-containing protein [Acidimicrobiia bacterium]
MPDQDHVVAEPARTERGIDAIVLVAVLAPIIGFVTLLAVPTADVAWEDHPAHFWLVLGTAALAAGLGWAMGITACRRADARVFLVSLAFVTAASFLGLHALATPGVLLDGPNEGFVVATPVGLLLASGFALWSSMRLDGERARWVLTRSSWLRLGVVAAVALWGAWSIAAVAPLDSLQPGETAKTELFLLAAPGVLLYAIAALRYLALATERRSPLALSVAAAWALLGETMLAIALARNWHATWWEWHLLMLAAFAAVTIVARRLPETERFGDLYLDEVAGGTRDVTVLFADLEGFTTYSEAHDSDVVQHMLNTYFSVVIPEVRAAGGRVDRYIGDAVMVTFNVSADQADHATLAARAALAFQDAAAGVASEHPDWPRFRVGLNTGPATVGLVGGGGEREYTVLGDTVNLASRLEGLAPPGGVVIGGSTLERLAGARVTSMGKVQVKGRDAPVDAWLLEAVGDPPR